MANMSGNWQKRVADTIDERLGLLDNPKSLKYRKTPVFIEPVGDGPKKPLTAFGITSGVGSMLIGADALGFKVVGNVEFRDYYRFRNSQKQSSLPNYFPGAFQARGIRDVPPDLLPTRIDFAAGHPECLPGNTRIYTSTGWKPIKEIELGELVLTHEHRFRPVVRTFKNLLPKGSKMYELRLGTSAEKVATVQKLILTGNHPVLTQKGWTNAEDVRPGDFMKVLSKSCPICSSKIPLWRTACSIAHAAQHQWEQAGYEERDLLLNKAHAKTRQRVAEGVHQFQDPVVRRRAMRTLSLNKNGSPLEDLLLSGMARAGVTGVSRQVRVGKYTLDFALVDLKIAIEADGVYWHRDKAKEESRDEFLKSEGWTVLHFEEDKIHKDPVACGEEVLRVASNHSGEYDTTWIEVGGVRSYNTRIDSQVYNLGVEEDHSYIAKGYVVHNCGLYSILSHPVTKGTYRDIRGKDAGDIPLFLRLVSELQPRFFLMDDLPGSFDALPMDEYVKMLPNYDLFPEWVSNWGYGNIQKHRNRMFIVGALKSENFVFRPGEASHNLVLSDALEGLPGFGGIANHAPVDPDYSPGRYVHMNAYGHRPTWRELETLLAGATHAQVKYYSPEGVQKTRPGTISPKIDGFCPVLSGQFNPLHPERVGPLTIRERARIQGFPDSFVFYHDEEGPFRKVWEPYNSDGQRGIKQTGKAMPIQFCTFVAAQVKAHIDGEDFEATDTRVIKANPKVDQAKKEYCKLSGYAQQAKACSMCWQKETCEVRSSRMV